MFKDLNQRKFYQAFKNEEDCKNYLYQLKWGKGFCCRRCKNTLCWKGRTRNHARCTKCDYDESVTAHTVFHHIQFPLLKAFVITFHLTAYKKGISCRNLSKIVSISLKSVWHFKRKVQNAMAPSLCSGKKKLLKLKKGNLDGIILTHREKLLNGLQRVEVNISCEENRKSVGKLLRMQANYGLPQRLPCTLVGGSYVNEGKDILIWNFKAWLTGTHHHCSEKYLQGYLNEYCFRYNLREKEHLIWPALMLSMILPEKPI